MSIYNDEALGRILSLSCHNGPDADGWNHYMVDLHCASLKVRARPYHKVTDDDGDYLYSLYEVSSVEVLTPVADDAMVIP